MAINQLTKCILRAVPDLPQQLDITGHDRHLLGCRMRRDLDRTVAGGPHSLPWPSKNSVPPRARVEYRPNVSVVHLFQTMASSLGAGLSRPVLRSLWARLKPL